jgi:hypothetical protein
MLGEDGAMSDASGNDPLTAALDAATAARGRAMTAFEEHLADSMIHLVRAIGQLDGRVDSLRSQGEHDQQ